MERKRHRVATGLRVDGATEAGFNISWASIAAGVVTFFSTLALLSLIGNAIGFGMVSPTTSNPLDGVGTGLLIWTVISLVLAFAAGGFVSGMAARRVGVLHGFLTWATSMILLLVMLFYIASTAISAVGSVLGSAFSLTGQGLSAVGSGVETVISDSIDAATGNLDDIDTNEFQGNVEDVLRDTDVPELQPEYLNDQLEEARTEVTDAGKELLTNPENADDILGSLTDSLSSRAQTIADAVDRDAIASAVASNTELTEQEAQEATDNIYNGLQKASTDAQKALDDAAKGIEQAKADLDQAVEDARVAAENASDATAKASIWAFVGLLIGMLLSAGAGMFGSKFVSNHDEEEM